MRIECSVFSQLKSKALHMKGMYYKVLAVVVIFALSVSADARACTAAIIGADATPDGRPLL